jgi:hypothetical protein
VSWLPAVGENRITSMTEGRGDWCISRQRKWGVPIPVFYDVDSGAPRAALSRDEWGAWGCGGAGARKALSRSRRRCCRRRLSVLLGGESGCVTRDVCRADMAQKNDSAQDVSGAGDAQGWGAVAGAACVAKGAPSLQARPDGPSRRALGWWCLPCSSWARPPPRQYIREACNHLSPIFLAIIAY